MDWGKFFEETREKAGARSFAELAPMLGISDGAISHYRTGKRVPQVWVVAECLRLQGVSHPEKAAIAIMKSEALTSPERAFWRKLAATAAVAGIALLAVQSFGGDHSTAAAFLVGLAIPESAMAYTLCEIRGSQGTAAEGPCSEVFSADALGLP